MILHHFGQYLEIYLDVQIKKRVAIFVKMIKIAQEMYAVIRTFLTPQI